MMGMGYLRSRGKDGERKCCSLAWIGNGPRTCYRINKGEIEEARTCIPGLSDVKRPLAVVGGLHGTQLAAIGRIRV